MTALLLFVVLGCPKALPLVEGAPAPCTGILWPVDKTRDAVACFKVDLPDCERRLTLLRETSKAELSGCKRSLSACKALARPVAPVEPPTPWKGYLLTGGGGVLVGLVAGVLLTVSL